ncbi:MAG TPA: TolC family protein [Kofleriaceae bacterium]
MVSSPGASSTARADVLGRILTAADDPTSGAPPPPQQTADLTAWAGEAKATSLPDLLQSAVRQTPALVNARIDIAIADARIQQTWARSDWKLTAQLQGGHSEGVEPGSTVVSTNDQFVGTADLSRLLVTGGTVGIHIGTEWDRVGFPLASPVDPELSVNTHVSSWTHTVGLALTQPLLRSRGSEIYDANEVKATLSRDAAVLERRQQAIVAVQNVVSAYWDLVLAERTVGITQASLDLARERLRVTTIGADGGKVARSEIPAVLQIIATREEDVLNGELGVLNAAIALRRAAGMPIGANDLGLRVATDLDIKEQAIDLGALTERAYTASPQLAELVKQDKSATLDIAVTENGLLPQLDAALTLGPAGTSPRFGTAVKNLVEFDSLSVQGTLTFAQSLGRNDVLGRARELHEQRRKLVVNAFDLRAMIAQTMARSVAQVELARRRVQLSQQAIDLANQNIKIETDRFNLGRSTNFDVLNRLEDLRQAELRKTQALIDWHKGEAAVQALTGDLLPLYGITVDN